MKSPEPAVDGAARLVDRGGDPLPWLVEARHRLAREVLAAAAAHSVVTDQLLDLDSTARQRPLDDDEQERQRELRMAKQAARRRHDEARRRLRLLSRGLSR